jgi:hypothetical protein
MRYPRLVQCFQSAEQAFLSEIHHVIVGKSDESDSAFLQDRRPTGRSSKRALSGNGDGVLLDQRGLEVGQTKVGLPKMIGQIAKEKRTSIILVPSPKGNVANGA